MELISKLKNGNKIHIKEKNKGSFRRWCGGNVTDECIRKGKNSSNPKIRKKATFADNARHWKHKDGGILQKYQIGGFINPAMAAIPYMNPNENSSPIVQAYYNNLLNQNQMLQMQEQKKQDELELKKLKLERQNQIFDKLTSLGGTILTNYLNSKINAAPSNENNL